MVNGDVEIKDFCEINESLAIVRAKETYARSENQTLYEVSAGLSLWVTACGRCMLYEKLDMLGTRALYYDTDSCPETPPRAGTPGRPLRVFLDFGPKLW